MPHINVLDISVANLIAAGEVVERPASVIKELLENSVDAGADNVTVEIKRGGVQFIRVADNGCGISREDAPVAIKRHATSKIHDKNDLDSIMTLGFRGEALAAIASVSHLRIITRTREEDSGTLLESDAGDDVTVTDTGSPVGTTVIVEELFANVPARRKFLKKDASESMAVIAVAEKLALSRPDIAIKLIIDGAVKFETAGTGRLDDAVYAVLGRDFAKKLVPADETTEGVTVSGYIGAPESARGNRNYENFFINGRYIKSLTAATALERAFESYIPDSKFPVCVLNIALHPALVDVNVHPTKLEVKFSNERAVFNAVYCSVRNALENRLPRPSLEDDTGSPRVKLTADGMGKLEGMVEQSLATAEESGDLTQRYDPDKDAAVSDAAEAIAAQDKAEPANTAQASAPASTDSPAAPVSGTPASDGAKPLTAEGGAAVPKRGDISPDNGDIPLERAKAAPNTGAALPGLESISDSRDLKSFAEPVNDVQASAEPVNSAKASAAPADSAQINASPVKKPFRAVDILYEPSDADTGDNVLPERQVFRQTELDGGTPKFRIAGIVFNCYIIVENGDKVLLIDKHAAHERILFEDMKQRMRAEGDRPAQLLFLPIELALSPEEKAAIADYSSEFSALGFDYSDTADGKTGLFQIPHELDTAAAEELFASLASALAGSSGDPRTERDAILEKALYTASCKAAMKAGRDDGTPEDLRWLVERVLSSPEIRVCPHGRPVAFETNKYGIEKLFKRV